ncbi:MULTISPECIES: HlyD family type I secretion periplasmic adaptor subunit [unclassified Pseudomonas]|jgi:adhesin transport system membrane fusion protein|uniref:HlyD family type I secretion periplasmic adaptor subunit n=1 Tax=unclassified Pseudomonas TaxID=196821 RepID=UPI00244B4D03|nr:MULTISPECIES: HlyD family type I secretion periplasmic adaptor subunit [unclassified Pseudomonas]MDG9929533.1 HlyD family type I secretion periplasmic adaptor subunit [Pseudomonas sp. GD04042]MDH0483589.1 HlyD family type I secretion periplasmic adaptor subunit [Pseudomonas sp. GD04015]MDH0606543.1 HlyD family type I secretion periplasmic adaptor subunit [Pseudomonas sp. GD03869]MDH0893899.1 HlyD family type I secretion periplasmic adaptor subunit [Pseudomonas sp. GD03875]MDH1064418.1 HlyD 
MWRDSFSQQLRGYFRGRESLAGQPLPEVRKALIEDAPRLVRLTLWSLIGFSLFALLWAHFAVVDEVTRGDGKAIPSSKLQKIQNLEGGIVAELFVREGQVVEAGAPLLRLDDTRFASNVGETEADRLALLLRVERLAAEVEEREPELPANALEAVPRLAASEQALYQSRRQQLQDEVAGLEEQLVQRRQELREYVSKRDQYQRGLNLLRQEIDMSEPLVAKGAISQVEVLRLRRSEVENRGQLDATTLAIPRAESAIKEVERKIAETRSRFRSDALTQLNEARTELSKVQASGKALEDRVNRTLVTSPVRGIVKQLLVNTIGGVIQPGSDLVEIVPLDDTLLVEARIRPQDIAFLHPGQKAMVKFTAYDYTIYGGLPAQLEQIGADTITDEEGNSFYLIQLRTEKSHLGSEESPLLIIPGMVASVDIITGHKSVLSYLLKPIIRARGEALRER